LTPLGAAESYKAGNEAAKRYKSEFKHAKPFVRTDSSPRVVDTAGNWTARFFEGSHAKLDPPILIIYGAAGVGHFLHAVQRYIT